MKNETIIALAHTTPAEHPNNEGSLIIKLYNCHIGVAPAPKNKIANGTFRTKSLLNPVSDNPINTAVLIVVTVSNIPINSERALDDVNDAGFIIDVQKIFGFTSDEELLSP